MPILSDISENCKKITSIQIENLNKSTVLHKVYITKKDQSKSSSIELKTHCSKNRLFKQK